MHSPDIRIGTERLILRLPRIEDFDAYAAKMANPEGSRYIGGSQVRETVLVDCDGIAVPIPAQAEQLRILQDFARPKDRQRAALLATLQPPGR